MPELRGLRVSGGRLCRRVSDRRLRTGPGAAGVIRGSHLTSTTVEVMRLATDLRCKIEINAEAITD